MEQHSNNDTGLLGEFSCLLIIVGLIWMMIPGTVAITDGCLCVTPNYIPLIIFGAGAAGVLLLSIATALRRG